MFRHEHLTADQAGSTYGRLGTWDYSYDAGSNELTGAFSSTNGTWVAGGAYHTYDTADRLITTRNLDTQNWGGIPAGGQTSWYTYDDLGNRISHRYRGATAIGYGHDKANRMTTLAAVTQAYDPAGNVVTGWSADRGTSYVYKWDHHNRLTAIYDGATGSTRKAAFAYDALGRRVEYINDKLGTTSRFAFDGVNELVEYDGSGNRSRYWAHGISYIDERLMMFRDTGSRPYYYVLDRMYNVRAIVDRAGAMVERIVYDGYGRPYIRELCGRGDMDNDSDLDSTDTTRFTNAKNASIWDPRADLDDDGDVDSADQTAYDTKQPTWDPENFEFGGPSVAQAFSDVGNFYLFQGVPHFALDTAADASEGKLLLNHHRARFADPATGRWITRDPLSYVNRVLARRSAPMSPLSRVSPSSTASRTGMQLPLYGCLMESPTTRLDPRGLCTIQFTQGECFLGWCHVGINIEDDNGNQTQIDGGPRNNPGGPGMPCCVETLDAYVQVNTGPVGPPATGAPPLHADQTYCDCVKNAAQNWNGTAHCYAAVTGPNSNSVVACILKACSPGGTPVDAPDDAWGWDDLYDHSTDHCTNPNSLPN